MFSHGGHVAVIHITRNSNFIERIVTPPNQVYKIIESGFLIFTKGFEFYDILCDGVSYNPGVPLEGV